MARRVDGAWNFIMQQHVGKSLCCLLLFAAVVLSAMQSVA